MKLRLFCSVACMALGLSTWGCGREVVRGSQDSSIDHKAMSTALDKTDIQEMLAENLNDLRTRPVMKEWLKADPKYTLSVLPFSNQTSEHIDSALHAAGSEAETWLIDSEAVRVVSSERRPELIDEMRLQNSGGFDPSSVSRFGRLLGVRYVLTGKVQAVDERLEDQRRVQYFLFMQVLDVETAEIVWQRKSYVSKLLR